MEFCFDSDCIISIVVLFVAFDLNFIIIILFVQPQILFLFHINSWESINFYFQSFFCAIYVSDFFFLKY